MITVKQYAEERHITIQAVHQSMNGKRKKERLEGHVQTIDGVKWLDEEAVRILDEARSKSPIVWEKTDTSARLEELEQNERIMLAKIATQADRISELAQWKADNAVAIAEANQNRLLLSAAEKDKRLLEGFIADAKAEIATLTGQKAQAEERARAEAQVAQKAQDELTAAQKLAAERERLLQEYAAAMEEWSALGWWHRRKKPKPVMPELPVQKEV